MHLVDEVVLATELNLEFQEQDHTSNRTSSGFPMNTHLTLSSSFVLVFCPPSLPSGSLFLFLPLLPPFRKGPEGSLVPGCYSRFPTEASPQRKSASRELQAFVKPRTHRFHIC